MASYHEKTYKAAALKPRTSQSQDNRANHLFTNTAQSNLPNLRIEPSTAGLNELLCRPTIRVKCSTLWRQFKFKFLTT